VSPEEKAAYIRNMAEAVLMVGDGINDAAALATATVGVAVGSGTNVAIDAADVVIPGHRPSSVPMLIVIARRTLRCIHQNLFFAFFYNSTMIPVAALGLLGPYGPLIAAGAMALSDITVVGNAVRLGRTLRRMPDFTE
jgi:P-type E1-E2 ATPase